MPIRWAYLKRVLAGAIFGLYMAHLLYLLNPQVDITPGRLAIVTIVYGLTCGLLFGSILWILRVLRVKLFGPPVEEGAYRAHGFGFIVLAAFLAAGSYWIHLLVFRTDRYLPLGAVRILSKSTNLITVVAFLLLLLWVGERNANRTTSRAIFVIAAVIIAVSSFFLYERRDSYRTDVRSVVVANIGTVAGQRPVIVIAIRNLPYDWIVTLDGEGRLPFLSHIRSRAYFTRVEPFSTTTPKALWASLATGKLPYQHGVAGRFSYRTALNGSGQSDRFLILPSGVGFSAWGLIPPVQRISAQLPSGDALPFWSMFERLSFPSAVVGWPSNPARGASRVVTDRFLSTHDVSHEVEPAGYGAIAGGMMQAPSPATMQRFNVGETARQRIVRGLTGDLSAMALVRAAASERKFELNVVALEGMSEAQKALHIYTNDLPARSTPKGESIRAYAEQIDRMLESVSRDFPDHLLVVVSPSGPMPPDIPSNVFAIGRELVDPTDPGADDGFMFVSGPGVTHRTRVDSALVVDLVPTLLYAAGLPVARDMDGRVLVDAFDDELLRSNMLSAIQTYEAKQVIVKRNPG